MNVEKEWRECVRCEYIEDCPHPDVDMNGEPIPPSECWQKNNVKLTRKPTIKPNESNRK